MTESFIGRYKVIEELGRGGMGIVYRGEDPALQRAVAIKVLPPKKLTKQKAIERFLREARLSAQLDHPNIIKIHDIGVEENIYHIVMEFVDGRTLREIIEERKSVKDIDLENMAEVFLEVAEAMAYAHGKKIIHRDLKPDNIMITRDGRVKVMDFGLAALENRHSLTEMGQVMGTVAYFSPEQAKGERADHRADIYSLGTVFYEMLTNQLVFSATNPGEMIAKHLTATPKDPKVYNPDIPGVFSDIILHVLKKSPDERIQNALEIAEMVEDWLDSRKFEAKGHSMISSSYKPATSGYSGRGVNGISKKAPKPTEPEKPRYKQGAEYQSGFMPESIADIQNRQSQTPGEPRKPADGPWRDMPAGGSFILPKQQTSEKKPPPPGQSRFKPSPSKGIRSGGFGSFMPEPEVEDFMPEREYDKPAQKMPPKALDVTPTAAETPVASTTWIQEADQEKQWGRYRYVLDKIHRDEEARERAGIGEALRVCPRCGAENDGTRKYCFECGNLISHSRFLTQKEAMSFNEKGMDYMRQNKLQEALIEFEKAIEKDPKLVQAFMNLGKVLGDMTRYREGRIAYREASKLMPDNPQPHILIADLYRLENRHDDAIYEYREALKIAPSDAFIRNQLALLYSQKGDIKRAIDEYKRILSADGENLEAHRQLGYMYMALENYEEAIGEFEWVINNDPEDEEVYQALGSLYVKTGQLNKAEFVFQSVLEVKPDDPESLAALGEVYEKQNKTDLALEHFDAAIRTDTGNIEARKKLADVYIRHNRPDLALNELETAAKINPDDPELQRTLGDLYLANRQPDKALRHLEKTVNLAPQSAELHHKLARLYGNKDYTELSLNEYSKAVKIEPYNPGYREDLSMAYYAQNRYDEAIAEMRKAATLDATNVDYQKALGVMFEETDQLEKAEKQFQKVIQLNPKDPMAQGMLGRVYSKQGLLSMSVFQYKRALEINPDSHLFNVYLGQALTKMGKLGEAAQAFKRAIELAPGGSAARGTRVLGKAYANLGRVYIEQGEISKAADVLKSAHKNNPNDPMTLHYLGILNLEQKKFPEALDYLSAALKMKPADAEIMKDLAKAYRGTGELTLALSLVKKSLLQVPSVDAYEVLSNLLMDMGNYTEAQNTLDEALDQCPEGNDHVYWIKGGLAAGRGQWEDAARLYENAININPEQWNYYKDLAVALEEMGRFARALKELQNALACNPEERFVQKIQNDIKRLNKKTNRYSD